jgi:hypothetical protein
MLSETPPPIPPKPKTPSSPASLYIRPHAYQLEYVCEYAGRTDPDGRHHNHPACLQHRCATCGLPQHNRHHS